MLVQYKCPNCAADMAFDSDNGMLSCKSCGLTLPIDEMENPTAKATAEGMQPQMTDGNTSADAGAANAEGAETEIFGDFEDFQEKTSTDTFRDDSASQYECENCGAILITDKDTTATHCKFCGAPMILGDRLVGELAPTKVIPFTISREKAEDAFRKWCHKGRVTPRDFLTPKRIKDITGMYVPFWLFDLNGRGEASATCTKVRSYTRGDYIYTDTSYYDVYRKVDLNYNSIPADASEKMPDDLMDKLEPFDYKDLKTFNTPYLAGFLAEKYNYTDKDLFPRIKGRVDKYITDYIQSTITGYSTSTFTRKWTDVLQRDANYVLLPVWMINYKYKDKDYMFAMNGQTGKVVGKPPISIPRVLSWFAGISAGIFAALRIITILLGGSIL